jgi:hypothetical protein
MKSETREEIKKIQVPWPRGDAGAGVAIHRGGGEEIISLLTSRCSDRDVSCIRG